MPKTLFLGLGKVTSALAKVCQGEKWAFVEDTRQTTLWNLNGREPSVESVYPGTFEDIDWPRFLPARVFLSPGVDPRRRFFAQLASSEVREVEEVLSRFQGRSIGITGTDGKSTFTFQLGELLKRAFPQRKIFVGGNLGTAMAESLDGNYEIAVYELSSFQCERWRGKGCDIGVLLNLAPDHLDRYDSLEDYFNQKWNLIRHAKWAFYPSDVERPAGLTLSSKAHFQNDSDLNEILKATAPMIVSQLSDGEVEFESNWLLNLPTLPHRLEVWRDAEGGIFVNDSKATTVHAACYGLQRIQSIAPCVKLILGGRAKGDDYSELVAFLRASDELLICGEAAPVIEEATIDFKGARRRYLTLKDALAHEISSVRKGQALLLSPACSSYDEFKNFEERGRYFLEEVRRLRGEICR